MKSLRLVIVSMCVLALAGCGPKTSKAPTSAKRKQSTVATAVDGLTGRTAVRAGQKAKDEIREISAKRDAELDEVLGK